MKSSSQKIKVKRENNLLEIFLFLTSKGSQDPREPVLVKFVFHEKVIVYNFILFFTKTLQSWM